MAKNQDKIASVGGQAVIEGVMMRGTSSMATAVRDSDGIIRTEKKRVKPNKERNLFFRLPFIRGFFAFFNSLFGGAKTLMRSAEVFGEAEPTKFEKFVSRKLKINISSAVALVSVTLGLVLALFLFIWLPVNLCNWMQGWFNTSFSVWAKNFIEGGIKLLVFLGYLFFCTLIKDVKRVFMYHGAEHKTITCYEKGLDLTVENVKNCSRVHDRCGTTFLVFVMLLSIILFALFESLLFTNNVILSKPLRILFKIALVPVVAGLSYELLKVLSKTNSIFVYPIKLPGILLQKLTTKEPDDKMIEVAITAFNTVLEMDNDPNIAEQEFVIMKKRKEVTNYVNSVLKKSGIDEDAEAEWIVSIMLGIKRSEVYTDNMVSARNQDKIYSVLNQRITGRPLWYCIGDTEFFGLKFLVDERVLIPRPETEILVEKALLDIKDGQTVLDMCTGSGAIAISISKNAKANVFAVDVSSDALDLAKENAKLNQANVEFIQSDLFSGLGDRTFDVIISNPPYIKSQDILSLEREVKDFEPKIALDGGEDGYFFYREIAKNIKNYIKPNGILLMECGVGQANDILELFENCKSKSIIKDYNDIDRIVRIEF